MRREVELSAGRIEYEDTGGDGPAIVLLHALMMDDSLWDDVIAPARRLDERFFGPITPPTARTPLTITLTTSMPSEPKLDRFLYQPPRTPD